MPERDAMPDDPLPAVQAGIDQMIASAPEIARAARGIFDAYTAEGFGSTPALYLTACHLYQEPGKPS